MAKVRADYAGERREQLHNQLLQNKLLEYLLSRATITESGAGEPAAETEAEPERKPKNPKPQGQEQGQVGREIRSQSRDRSARKEEGRIQESQSRATTTKAS